LSGLLSGGAAVVTGAASGIGRALARRLAAEGASLALADLDEAGLNETVAGIAGRGIQVSTHVVDVADSKRVETFAREVVERHGKVTLLVNNAGVALHGNFSELTFAEIDWLMGINFWGVVYGTKYFLPHLLGQPRAHIVNLSSIFGIVAPAGQTAYGASKFAVRGFTEALRHELEDTSVRVICVHPGGIRTPIARRARVAAAVDPAVRDENVARFERLAKTSPEAAAERIVRGIERDEPRILVGADAIRLDRLQRLLPGRYWKLLRKQLE
jgi:short-subunit dehydrogenase